MTPEQITKWASEAGIYLDGANQRQPLYVAKPEELQAFAALIRNATLEEAAVKCDAAAKPEKECLAQSDEQWAASVLASRIRAMK